MNCTINGELIIIGGAEDKSGNREILTKVAGMINKEEDTMIVSTLASDLGKEVGYDYKNLFHNLGVKNVEILDISSREECEDKNFLEMVKKASLIFFTGGNQLKITSLIGGTSLHEEMKKLHRNGGIFAGTSAGASVMSETMIVRGPDEESPKKHNLSKCAGLGFMHGVMIDQHFAQRGRIGRLLGAIAENPDVLGIGIDEDTAIVVNKKEEYFSVIGSGAVYVIDGRNLTYSSLLEQESEVPLSLFNVKMHVLKSGNCFDLNKKQPLEEERIR